MAGRALSLRKIRAASTRSFSASLPINSGIDTLTGQPATQGRVLHSRQRCASRIASSRDSPWLTSVKTLLRTSASRSGMWTRLMASRSLMERLEVMVSPVDSSGNRQPRGYDRCRGGRKDCRNQPCVRRTPVRSHMQNGFLRPPIPGSRHTCRCRRS